MEDTEWLIDIINDPTISDEEKLETMEDEGLSLEEMFYFVINCREKILKEMYAAK